MKVKDLIQLLQQQNTELDVALVDDEYGWAVSIVSVETVYLNTSRARMLGITSATVILET